ncbi:MAG: [FeFe] hydrogenase H-cluster radical SAM maturase HydG [Prevotellaceae bacterium]|jgi:2-iminoacetate synthase|nr:[FeFe] hydrogenase H-cluster radical SAM maturase HydG [Prevotellaceae bacterium]
MLFKPQKYTISDISKQTFIDADEIWKYINNTKSNAQRVREIIAKSLNKQRLALEEAAVLLNTTNPELIEEIKQGARTLKTNVYGKRIVLFAPLYIGNYCSNNCLYCGFRSSNKEAQRLTLNDKQIIQEVEALEDNGQKRLILVYGEHREYSPEYIAHTVRVVYNVKKGNGEIRRVNINAAPLDVEGFKVVKEAGIGTYQIFQETYHPKAYKFYHRGGKKMDYDWRLTALDRAMEAGIDDVGIGALFGLYDWRFEALSLLRHVNHLEACYNIGPHTISFPRLQAASSRDIDVAYKVSDDDFLRLIAILRLAVPYTGLILTARESDRVRKEAIAFGISQIDGGTKLELGGYQEGESKPEQDLNREQFQINDNRTLNKVIDELLEGGYLPSFCTACYRRGRTGEHFMEFSVPGFIKRYCTPNAILTLAEYIRDYATPEVAAKGWTAIQRNLSQVDDKFLPELLQRIERIKADERDIYF